MSGRRSGIAAGDLAPAGAVLAAAVALWLLTGASAWEVARYVAYELVLVIAPGWLLLRAVAPGIRSNLVRLAIAWPLGLAIELAAFTLTAALDVREALPFVQLAVACAALVVWRRRGDGARDAAARGEAAAGLGRGPSWALAAVVAALFAYIALSLFASTPLPGTVELVRYPTDVLFHISIAADLKHHAFPSTPEVADVPLRYHHFVYAHHAAASQVTGIELPVVALRLAPLALGALMLVGIAAAGRLFTGDARCAPIAAALFLIASELDLFVTEPFPLLGVRDVWPWLSPTYVLGVIAFALALMLAGALIDRGVGRRLGMSRTTAWCLLVVALALGSGAKSVVLPTLLAGLAVFAALGWWRRREPDRTEAALVALVAGIFCLTYAFLYLDGGDGGLELGLGKPYERMAPLALFEPSIPDFLPVEIAFWGIGALLASALLFGSIAVPLAWRLAPSGPGIGPGDRMLLCMLVPGVAAWLFLFTVNVDNGYFTALALVAVLPLAAQGVLRAFSALGSLRSRRGAAALAQLLVVALLLAGAAWALMRDGQLKLGHALVYGPLLLAAAGGLLWLLRTPRGCRSAPAAALTMALLAIASLNLLLDSAPEKARLALRGEPLHLEFGGIGRDEVAAAQWARDNLPGDAVIATANDSEQGPPPVLLSLRTDVPALAERRVLYEGWAYSTRSQDWTGTVGGTITPYGDRRELQRRAVYGGDPTALREISVRFGVTHLLLRRGDPRIPSSVRTAGEVVFRNEQFEIVELPGAADT